MRRAALAHLSQAACRTFCGIESGAAHEARSEAPKAGGWRILRVVRCLADEDIGNRSKFKGQKYRFALIPLGHHAMVEGAKKLPLSSAHAMLIPIADAFSPRASAMCGAARKPYTATAGFSRKKS